MTPGAVVLARCAPSRRAPFNAVDGFGTVRHISLMMKTATVSDLRNHFPLVAAWIEEGEPVEITKAGKPFARVVLVAPEKARRFKMPDIMARLERTFGDSTYDAADLARGLAASRRELSRPLTWTQVFRARST